MEKHKYAWDRILGEKMKPDTQLHLPPLFETCINYLEERALDREGVFRVPGSARQVAVLKEAFKSAKPGETVDISDEDLFTICSLLSDYLRNEEPLLTYAMADEWVNVAAVSDWILRLAKIAALIEELPLVNHAQLYLLLNLLVKVGKNADVTRMGNNNLGTIFGPMICRRKNSSPATELRDVPRVSSLCIELLNRFEELFPTEEGDTLGKHQKRGGRNMNATQKKLETPEVSEAEASGEGETDTSRPGKPLKSLSQMGNFYVKPKSPRNGEDHKAVAKSPIKQGSAPIKLDLEGVTEFKKMDEEEIRRRSRTVGSISIKGNMGGATVSGGSARRPSKVNEEDVLVMRMRSKSSRNNREDEKKSSSAESADLFSEEEIDKDAFRFGGKLIPITKPKRRSTSWPEVEVADFKRKMQQTIIEELLDGSTEPPAETSGNEKSPEKEGEIRKQFEMKKKLLELKKKELESRKAEIIKRLESSGNVITTLEEKEKEEGGGSVNEEDEVGGEGEGEGGSKLRKRKGSEGSDAVESKLRRWKLRHQKIQEELKNIKMHSSPKKSRSQRTSKRSSKSDEEGADEIEQKKYNSHDGSQKARKRSDSDSSSESEGEESTHVMYVIEKFYGKSKSARETRRTKSKNDLREKSPSPADEAFPGIKCHTELDPPSEIKRRYSEEMKRSREMVAKKWEKENKNKEHPSEISGWQLEQLKKLRQEKEIERLKKKLAKKEKEAEREREKEKENEEEKTAEKEEGETTTPTNEPGSPGRKKKKKSKGSARRKLIKKIEDEEKKLCELNLQEDGADASVDQDQMKQLASEGMCATGAEI